MLHLIFVLFAMTPMYCNGIVIKLKVHVYQLQLLAKVIKMDVIHVQLQEEDVNYVKQGIRQKS